MRQESGMCSEQDSVLEAEVGLGGVWLCGPSAVLMTSGLTLSCRQGLLVVGGLRFVPCKHSVSGGGLRRICAEGGRDSRLWWVRRCFCTVRLLWPDADVAGKFFLLGQSCPDALEVLGVA